MPHSSKHFWTLEISFLIFIPNEIKNTSIEYIPDYSEDGGFAINPWTKVEFQNDSINIYESMALAMGNYFFTDLNGNKTKVEYTFAYIKDDLGDLKIILHHSSLPYSLA